MHDSYRISIEVLANAFTVEVPDMEARAKKKAEAKKGNKGSGYSEPYLGDCTKKFAAKNVKEAVKIVETAMQGLMSADYDEAFEEAGSKK